MKKYYVIKLYYPDYPKNQKYGYLKYGHMGGYSYTYTYWEAAKFKSKEKAQEYMNTKGPRKIPHEICKVTIEMVAKGGKDKF